MSDLDYRRPDTRPTSLGPFASAATAVVICAVLTLAKLLGMPLTMRTVLSVLIPGMTVATLLLFVSMGWIFLLFGRTKGRPRWLFGTGVAIGIAMLELLTLTYMAGQQP